MTGSNIRVRFAPSPSGELHVGNARTALVNWIFARHCGGVFILRIEDTDRLRTTRTFEENLLEDLKWLGIDWDEGPGRECAHGPYRQSERLDFYRDSLDRLIANGSVYPCYCTEEELEIERASLVARKMMPRYMGKCRRLTQAERERLEIDGGRRPVWRFRVEEGPILFDDLIRGSMVFQGDAIGDFIIVRSSGIPSYNFAVVVDDHFMEISHVIRGEDHLSNTAAQILLYRALGFTPPVFAHHSLILGMDHAKLSKRHGAVSVGEFRRRGILPEVLLNALALIGTSSGIGREVLTARELSESFSLDHTGKSGAIFDEGKLLWLNGLQIRRYETKALTKLLLPFIRAAGYDESMRTSDEWEQMVAAVQDNLATLSDIGDLVALFHDDRYPIEAEAATLLKSEEAKKILIALRGQLEKESLLPFTSIIRQISEETGSRGKMLYLPIRAALTGRMHGPELDRLFPLLDRASLLRRVEKALF
jgi:nondiscriminating glutamyl-tRNA synthetase